jgi:hypothetical protein
VTTLPAAYAASLILAGRTAKTTADTSQLLCALGLKASHNAARQVVMRLVRERLLLPLDGGGFVPGSALKEARNRLSPRVEATRAKPESEPPVGSVVAFRGLSSRPTAITHRVEAWKRWEEGWFHAGAGLGSLNGWTWQRLLDMYPDSQLTLLKP